MSWRQTGTAALLVASHTDVLAPRPKKSRKEALERR